MCGAENHGSWRGWRRVTRRRSTDEQTSKDARLSRPAGRADGCAGAELTRRVTLGRGTEAWAAERQPLDGWKRHRLDIWRNGTESTR
eukprot:scaffold3352_cov130-Isochrysis_galbana.AAC.4